MTRNKVLNRVKEVMMERKVRPIIWRLFHRKKRRVSDRAFQRLLDIHLKMHQEMIVREKAEAMTVDGQFYDAAVEKYTEFMTEKRVMETKGVVELGEEPLTKTDILDDIPVVRVSEIPKLFLLLGVRIRG